MKTADAKPPAAKDSTGAALSAPDTGHLADEGGSFSVASATLVQYGTGSSWVQKTVTGSATCSNAFFGQDPLPGVVKACYSLDSATATSGTGATAATGTAVSTTAPALANDILNSSGAVDATAYRATAAAMSKDAGIAYRYGQSAAELGTTSAGLPTWPQRANNLLPGGYSAKVPTYWQLGGPVNGAFGDYSTNQAQAAFVADNPAAAVGGVGVATLETLAMRENTFTQSPGLSWTAYGGGLDDSTALAYNARGPVALGRCYGWPTWCVNSLMAFQSGLIGAAGTNTSSVPLAAQLDAGLVPTAVAVTNGAEFALVTVWDTVNVRGRLAVIALTEKDRSTWAGVAYPGLPNQGAWGFMKIVGYVELPDMKAPTDVSVATGIDPESMHRLYMPGQSSEFTESTSFDIRPEQNRVTFAAGGPNSGSYASQGIAVVTSKSERKATFIDLKPLFAYYRSVYFTAGNRASFDNAVNNLGQAPNQWPYAFSAAPSQTPTVIKTVSFASRPTAAKVSLYGNKRAWVATEDGTLHIYSVGEYLNGTNATPSMVAETGTLAVGKNPTHIAYDKSGLDGSSVIVVSRGERKIDWVTFSGNGGTIAKTLRDTRMVDPISAEPNDNHGTESHILTVADYGGKQIANYRHGPVIFWSNPGGACPPPNGCGMAGEFEFGGAFALPGKPFHVTGANVP